MSKKITSNREAVAIIGMACVFPQAPDLETFWCNILHSVNAIGEPLPAWEADRYLKSNRINSPNGGFLRDLYRFDPQQFGIMPNSVDGGESDHYLALRVARDALLDAGYVGTVYDHQDTGIILGHSTYLHRGQGNLIQHHIILDQTIELLQTMYPRLDSARVAEVRKILKKNLPQYNADIVSGLVPNVMTGLIANRLNLKGPNYLIDGACSSSLLAVNAAIDELRNGRSRMMLTGGVNASLPAEVAVIFTEIGALSKKGQIRPFDAESDGTLLGEGLGIVVLKMVQDAIDDGDRIYAIIHGIGQASDGKGHGLLAPSAEGQALAIKRAYSDSGINPSSIDLVEAHGTGIPLGDKTEISALKKILGARQGAYGSVAIGSIKSMISHCIPAAGIAGLIKTALALHHKILPPTLCEKVNPDLGIEETPLYVNTRPRPWLIRPGTPRRAGINSFGFGGINTHAILEEAPDTAAKPLRLSDWPVEICVFAAHSIEDLTEQLKTTVKLIGESPQYRIGEIASALLGEINDGHYRLAIVVNSIDDLTKKIEQTIKDIIQKKQKRWSTRNGIVFSCEPVEGQIAFMFPGEGSQYLEMFSDLAIYFDEVRIWFDFWSGLYNEIPGESRTDIIFPNHSELTDQNRKKLEARLNDMDVGSEAAFIGGQAMHELLTHLGIKADVMVGHSTGESSALAASGAISFDHQSELAVFIRKLNDVYHKVLNDGNIPTGSMLAVGALSRDDVELHLNNVDKNIFIAMENCPNQFVLFGSSDSIDRLHKILGDVGGICFPLPFDRGYHTPLFSYVSEAFVKYYEIIGLKNPSVPLYSCSSAMLFPEDVSAIRSLAADQWSTKVRFAETISNMYRDGVRYFIEVGPSGNLSAFVNDILSGKQYFSLPTNIRRKNSLEQLLLVLAHLFVNNKEINLKKLFDPRSINTINLNNLTKKKNEGIFLKNTMPVIHLNGTDGAEMFNLLSFSDRSTEEIPDKSSIEKHSHDKFQQKENQEISIIDNQYIMSEYFNLMHNFLDKQNMFMEKFAVKDNDTHVITQERTFTPFLHTVSELDNHRFKGVCRLSIFKENFLRDHILSGPVSDVDPELFGLSCVPLMVSLEIMAEACAMIANSKNITLIENIKAFGWIALDDDSISLDVEATLISSDHKKYRAYLFNKGTKVVTADFSFEAQLSRQRLDSLLQKNSYRWQNHELYTIGMFHGPLFQSIKAIEGWDDTGIDANLSNVSLDGFFVDEETPDLILNPVLLDAAGQLAAYWIAQQVGTDFNCFPSSINRIELYAECPQNINNLTMKARFKPLDPNRTSAEDQKEWHFECHDSNGKPVCKISGLVNVYYEVPHRFYSFRRNPHDGRLGNLHSMIPDDDIVLWELQHFSEIFCAQSERIFLRILANALLNFTERVLWSEVVGKNIRYQRQWLLGRACIKEAVLWWIHQQTGKRLYPSDIVVMHDDLGAPYIDGWWRDILIPAPEVSLSHDQRMSVAAVSTPEIAIGVDIEQRGRIRHPDSVANSLNEHERILVKDLEGEILNDTLLCFLCAKEAAAKCLGLGLQGQPEQYQVHFEKGDWDRARVVFNETITNVKIHRKNDTILALATS